jgi:dipeptidyl aminopeptidase/acylaminoacyl peptidase
MRCSIRFWRTKGSRFSRSIIAAAESGEEIFGCDPLQYGGVELKDQLAALDQLYAQFPQLDRTRTGIWGWSYGGSMTLYALTHSDRFKAGISVAPVTNWRDYDSIYTERYMGLPKDNPRGYDDSIVGSAKQPARVVAAGARHQR